jgi:Homeodomain-like domain
MRAGPDIGRREAVMQLLGTGLTPRQVGRRLGVSANAVYNIRRKVTGGPIRELGRPVPNEPVCGRCGLRGKHVCLRADSIRWHPL